MVTETVAIAPKPDQIEREDVPVIAENEPWPMFAARVLAWGVRGWDLAEQRLEAIQQAQDEAQNINSQN